MFRPEIKSRTSSQTDDQVCGIPWMVVVVLGPVLSPVFDMADKQASRH